jgi:hypothetical protein
MKEHAGHKQEGMMTTAIEHVPQRDPQQAELTPMSLLHIAAQRGATMDELQKFMELQERAEQNQAKRSFNAAFASFKAEAIKLVRTKLITDGPLKNRKHVELGEVVRVATPALSKHGLSISWKLTKDEPQWMEVTCTLRHIDGHAEVVSMGGAPDTGPGRNAIQARGSAKTYLERYTATAILGLAPEEDNDGAGAPQPVGASMPEGQVADYLAAIEASGDTDELQKRYFEARDAAEKVGDKSALMAFANLKNDRFRKLSKAVAK